METQSISDAPSIKRPELRTQYLITEKKKLEFKKTSGKELSLFELNAKENMTQKIMTKIIENKNSGLEEKIPHRNVTKTFFLLRKFATALKSLTLKKIPVFLSPKNLKIINDLSFFYDVWKKTLSHDDKRGLRTSFHQFLIDLIELASRRIRIIMKHLIIFESSWSSMTIWNLIYLIICFWNFFIIPLEICFNVELSGEAVIMGNSQFFCMFFYFVDMLFICNTAVYIHGKLVKSRFEIIKHYCKHNLIYDVISQASICFHVYSYNNNTSIFRLFFFFKIMSLFTRVKKIEEILFFNESAYNFLSLVKLILGIIFFTHIFACLWYSVGVLDLENSWLSAKSLVFSDWYVKYLNSFYFVCITMNTVGYGDITPMNTKEKLFSIVFTYIACGVFAYTLNSIGFIVKEIAKRESEYQYNLHIMNDLMKRKNVSFDLKMRVRKYMEYIWYEEKIGKINEEAKIVQRLSDSLKEELLLEANGGILQNLKIFSLNFSEFFLKKTIHLLHEVRFTPGETIFLRGENNNSDLFIVLKGRVELFLDTKKQYENATVLKVLKKGETFGEISFFSDLPQDFCARSTDFTTVYRIRKEKFMDLIQKFDLDYQRMCEIRDEIIIHHNYKHLYMECYCCKEKQHFIIECPLLTYKLKRGLIISKFLHSSNQQRTGYLRKRQKSKHLMMQVRMEETYGLFRISPSENDGPMVPVDSQVKSAFSKDSLSEIPKEINYKKVDSAKILQDVNDFFNSPLKKIKLQRTKSFESKTNNAANFNLENTLQESSDAKSEKVVIKKEAQTKSFNAVSSTSILKESRKKCLGTNFFGVLEFEKMKSWRGYCPHNNFEKICLTLLKNLASKKVEKKELAKKIETQCFNERKMKFVIPKIKKKQEYTFGKKLKKKSNFFGRKMNESSFKQNKNINNLRFKAYLNFDKLLGNLRKKTDLEVKI